MRDDNGIVQLWLISPQGGEPRQLTHNKTDIQSADMFSNGGTDGGAVHLTGTGVPTVVMGPATRHGHCAASIADCRDILQMQQLLSALIQRLTRETVVQLTDFR